MARRSVPKFGRRWSSTQKAHRTSSHCAWPTHAMASTLGGGARRGCRLDREQERDQPREPPPAAASTGFVVRAYDHAPRTKIGTSIAIVRGREDHAFNPPGSPSPGTAAVGPVDDRIQHPVAHDQCREDEGVADVASHEQVRHADDDRPPEHRGELCDTG